jgi:hypothetical protein
MTKSLKHKGHEVHKGFVFKAFVPSPALAPGASVVSSVVNRFQ